MKNSICDTLGIRKTVQQIDIYICTGCIIKFDIICDVNMIKKIF